MYYDETLRQLREKMARKRRIDGELGALRTRGDTLAAKVSQFEKTKLREQADVDRLERRSLAAFYYNALGRMEEKLTQERREAYAAAAKYDAAVRELEAVKEDVSRLEAELSELEGCERAYEETLKAKAEAVKAAGAREAEEIFRLEERIAALEGEKKELGEAALAGAEAYNIADGVLSSLDKAEDWSTFDVMGGGFLSDMIKYDHLDDAQNQIENLQIALGRFKTELTDVTVRADIRVGVDECLYVADYIFDNIFSDWAVLDHIGQSIKQVRGTMEQVNAVIRALDDRLSAAEQERAEAKAKLDELILRAKV